MTAYYNENDPFAAQWLKNLIAVGHIAPGEVDDRSILDVSHRDLRGFDQCHFFAGIGGWSRALRLAGWLDARPVWTGSCPCQPFSNAGRGDGFADERHLWPAWYELIRQCRPLVIFGEQVASKDALTWLDHVCADLENEDYAIGTIDSCAAGFGSPMLRSRLYFVAEPDSGAGRPVSGESARDQRGEPDGNGGALGVMGDADDAGSQGWREHGDGAGERASRPAGMATGGFWANAEWLTCRDGKSRPTEPGTFPLAHGVPSRVGRLRAYGNAIAPPHAAEVIKAYLNL